MTFRPSKTSSTQWTRMATVNWTTRSSPPASSKMKCRKAPHQIPTFRRRADSLPPTSQLEKIRRSLSWIFSKTSSRLAEPEASSVSRGSSTSWMTMARPVFRFQSSSRSARTTESLFPRKTSQPCSKPSIRMATAPSTTLSS